VRNISKGNKVLDLPKCELDLVYLRKTNDVLQRLKVGPTNNQQTLACNRYKMTKGIN